MTENERRYRKRTLSTKKIIDLYEAGESTTDIAKLANVSARYIGMLLNKNNVKRRPVGRWVRKYSLNENYFKSWSKNMAYILGFFCADGMIAQNAQLISFSQKEKYILEEIKKEMKSDHPIIQNDKTGVYILNLNSKILKDNLMNIHGITPNKAHHLNFPKVPNEYINHFIRGYFDGDGFVTYEKFFVSFVGGSEMFMKQLRNKIEKAGFETNFTEHTTYFRVYVSGRKTIKLFSNWLYDNKGLFLKRKYDEFQREKLPISHLKDKEYKTHKNALRKRRRSSGKKA